MNPLPFFPPPARAFSQTGRESYNRPSSSRSAHSTSNSNSNSNPDRPPNNNSNNASTSSSSSTLNPGKSNKTIPSINFASLRLTSSHHGAAASNTTRSSTPASGSNSPSAKSASKRFTVSSSGTPSAASTSPHSPALESHSVHDSSRDPVSEPSQSLSSANMSSTDSNASSNSSGHTTPPQHQQQQSQPQQSLSASPRHITSPRITSNPSRDPSRSSSGTSSRRPSRSNTSSITVPSGRTGMNLPKGIFFDYVRAEEVAHCHSLETRAYDAEDQASRDRMRYRQKNAPHLFFAAFVPTAPPKVAGPLSVGHYSTPRKLIAYINGTASSNLSARSLAVHSVSNPEEGVEAWLVCLHSIVVDEAFRRKGVGLRLLEELMTRLRRIEDGRGDPRKGPLEKPKGYESVALLCHHESLRFFRKAGFQLQGISHVRCGSGGWIEMRRTIKGNHTLGTSLSSPGPASLITNSSSGDDSSAPVALDTSAVTALSQDAEWAFSASPTAVENTGAPLAAFPTGTGRHEIAAANAAAADQQEDSTGEDKSASDTPNATIQGLPMPSSPPADTVAPQASSSGLGGLGGFSQASLMAALAASSKGYAPGTNPSMPFSSVLGQTMAGKTFVEDAFVALEARLVDRCKGREGEAEEGTNLAEIWCPREECGCKIIRKGVAMWELAESGPLSDPNLSVSSMPAHASPLPPTPQPPPAPASHIRALKEREREHLKAKKDGETYSTRSTLPGAPPSHETSTPIRPFWSLLNPMSFENVAFSKDVKWTPPLPHDRDGKQEDEAGTGSGIKTPPEDGASNGGSSSAGGQTATGASAPSQKVRKPVRRPTFFSKKDKDSSNSSAASSLQISHPHRESSSAGYSGSAGAAAGPGSPSAGASGANGATPLTIKYILCGNCETGPLGYVIIPPKLSDGRLGEQVGNELNSNNNNQSGGSNGSNTPSGIQDIQIYLLAAERVRYRFVK